MYSSAASWKYGTVYQNGTREAQTGHFELTPAKSTPVQVGGMFHTLILRSRGVPGSVNFTKYKVALSIGINKNTHTIEDDDILLCGVNVIDIDGYTIESDSVFFSWMINTITYQYHKLILMWISAIM